MAMAGEGAWGSGGGELLGGRYEVERTLGRVIPRGLALFPDRRPSYPPRPPPPARPRPRTHPKACPPATSWLPPAGGAL